MRKMIEERRGCSHNWNSLKKPRLSTFIFLLFSQEQFFRAPHHGGKVRISSYR
jgi:hypothetical protein